MKRTLLAMLCFTLVVSLPATSLGNAGAILSQLKGIEQQTRTARNLNDAKREKIGARVRDLTQQFYKLPKRDSKASAEFGRLSASIWKNLREQSVEPRMRGLPAWATPRDKEFERQLEAIEARCRNLPKPVSARGLLGKPKAEAVRRLRDDVVRFVHEYRRALRQYRTDMALVRRYKPESRPGVYKLEQARAMLGKRALKQLQEAPGKSREALASQATKWLDDAKSDLAREANLKPGMPGLSPWGGIDPILQEVFPHLQPGDPHPLLLPRWSPNDGGTESDYEKVKRLSDERYHGRVVELGLEINETLESVWNVALIGAALDQQLGGDAGVWQPTIKEVERIARVRNFKLTNRLNEPRVLRD